jgi:FG-GAP repeat protein
VSNPRRTRAVASSVLGTFVLALLLAGQGAASATHRSHSSAGRAASHSASPSFADFNGDGYSDVATSALYEDVGSFTDAGAVNVLYGSSSGIQATNPANQFWTAGSQGMLGSPEAGAQFGFCLAQGDFNADGFTDLAICVPYMDVGPVIDAGALEVLYGSAAGLQATGVGGPDDQLWTKDSPGVIGDPTAVDALARSVASGDFNGDGYMDLAVDIRGEDVGPAVDAGGVEILYGSVAGIQATGTGGPDDQLWTQDSPGVEDQSESNDWFGRNLATGDFNGDGYADLAAGDFLEDLGPSLKDGGAVEVLYGSADGLQATGTGAPADQFWTQDSPGVADQTEAGDYFGHTVASADFNGDGYGDLAVSSRLEDIGRFPNTGGVEVLYGTGAGLQADAPNDRFWTQDSQGVLNEARRHDQFGFSLAAADFNGDSFGDLAVGVPFKGVPPNRDAGEVAVLYGSASGLQATGVGGPDDQEWNQDSPNVLGHAEPDDTFGISLAAGDYDGNGTADLAIGVNHEGVEPGPVAAAGAVAILYSKLGPGLQAVLPNDQLWTQDSFGVLDQSETDDEMGWWVT